MSHSSPRLADRIPDPRAAWRLVALASIAQLMSWGAITYSFSVIAGPMERELGWSRDLIYGALTIGLLVGGAAAFPLGAWIDRHGGRRVMTAGSLLAAASLAAWARVEQPWMFFAVCIGLGVASAAILYEPLFAVLVRLFPVSYSGKITAVTLVAGFASTVFIPLIQLGITLWGWRLTLDLLALCLIALCAPIHWFGLAADRPGLTPPEAETGRRGVFAQGWPLLRRALRRRAFWGLLICFTAYYGGFTALIFHMIPLLTELGVDQGPMLAAVALIGPAQVAGRAVLMAVRRHAPMRRVGIGVTALYAASPLLLLAAPGTPALLYVFAVAFGLANGLMTIVRGAATPEFLGLAGYGAINGALSLPATAAKALSPLGAALVWRLAGGYDAILWLAALGGAVSLGGFLLAVSDARPE